jgi:cation diffusion facilitator CzcD-associated flavoprotein CzcO
MTHSATERFENVIVGSGFSGLAMAHRLKQDGREDFVVLERADDVGGTWRDNTYPGCRCDVPSHLYSFSFAPNPDWSTTFSPQPEIQAYLKRVAADQGLLAHVRLGCELEDARWDPAARLWRLRTSSGEIEARYLIAGPGPLHEPKFPDVPGLGEFRGTVFHSAAWDHDHDLRGRRVAVVGTGASAIQFVPQIQPEVEQLHLFQRTPAWVMPRRDRPLSRFERRLYRRFPAAQRLMRGAIYWARELFALPMIHNTLSPVTRRLGIRHLESQVPDPDLREKLTPAYAPGCKRILQANDYFPALARENVDVVPEGIAEVRESSIVGTDGTEREVDTIIFGTGFHVTDLPIGDRIRDGEGLTLSERWGGSPQAYRGTTVAGYPNLFILLGPNTGLGHNSVVVMAEAQADYVMAALRRARAAGAAAVEVTPEAQDEWNAEIQRRMKGTVWTEGGCSSWYFDRNGRNTTLWPDFSYRFVRALGTFDPAAHRFSAPAEEPARPQAPAQLVAA